MRGLTVVCFVALFGLGLARYANHHDAQALIKTVRHHGYELRNYTVQTEDGYLLDLFRMPVGGQRETTTSRSSNNNQDSSSSEENSSSQQRSDDRPVVLLMHNCLTSSDDFILPGPESGLAYYMADRGYDVFIGNVRGNHYGRRHTTLNPDRDSAFWNYCWHHMGTKDLPAIVDKVLEISGRSRINYVGHMQGSTIFYVLTSERPEYNDKFEKVVSLGPLAYMNHGESRMFKQIIEHMDQEQWVIKNMGSNRFVPSSEFVNNGGEQECTKRGIESKICSNFYFLFFGYDNKYFNMTTINEMLDKVPAGVSVKQLLHYARVMKEGKFSKPSDIATDEEYDLSQVKVPVALFYVPEDYVVPESDVEQLKAKLPNVAHEYKFTELSNNIDLLYAKNVPQFVYKNIISFFSMNKALRRQ